jgi:hypothetical protein
MSDSGYFLTPINNNDDGISITMKLVKQCITQVHYTDDEAVNVHLAKMDLMFLKAIAHKAAKRESSRAKKFAYPTWRLWSIFGSHRSLHSIAYVFEMMRREIRQTLPHPDPTDINIKLLKFIYKNTTCTMLDALIEQIAVPWYRGEDVVYSRLAFDPEKSRGIDRTKGVLWTGS